jgi:hypothetical protein
MPRSYSSVSSSTLRTLAYLYSFAARAFDRALKLEFGRPPGRYRSIRKTLLPMKIVENECGKLRIKMTMWDRLQSRIDAR